MPLIPRRDNVYTLGYAFSSSCIPIITYRNLGTPCGGWKTILNNSIPKDGIVLYFFLFVSQIVS